MTDADLIRKLGGPKKVAQLLGFGEGGHQRVCNWMHRGIPWRVKAERQALFTMALDAQRANQQRKTKATPRQSRATA